MRRQKHEDDFSNWTRDDSVQLALFVSLLTPLHVNYNKISETFRSIVTLFEPLTVATASTCRLVSEKLDFFNVIYLLLQ